MGDRKAACHYFDPQFDPNRLGRSKRKPCNDLADVRIALPFTLQCNECHTFLSVGTKFNAKKEKAGFYINVIPLLRFYCKCSHCKQTLALKTDPKNADYEVEGGATRCYETKKGHEQFEDKSALDKKHRALEELILASHREMADQDELEALLARNRYIERLQLIHERLLERLGMEIHPDSFH